ncbi:CoA-binding protein [Leptobacterium sp. I13]|uniref:CoA-binding protein n=1 Tax=Leptobacterium meishanense TaxID=3128904 RepID=UPI0030EE6C11
MSKTLVIGASLKPHRYSNIAVQRLVNHGEEVVAYGLRKGKVSGVVIDTELKIYENVDTVTLYLNPKNQKAFYDYIVSLHPKRVIFNPGTENEEFYTILKQHDIVVEVACTLVLLSTGQY